MRTSTTRLALILLGGFELVATQAFAGTTLEWLVVGGGALALLVAAADAVAATRAQRALDGVAGVLGAWMVVEALLFSGSVALWLSFGAAAALVAVGVVGLLLHELRTERVVHELSVAPAAPVAEREPELVA